MNGWRQLIKIGKTSIALKQLPRMHKFTYDFFPLINFDFLAENLDGATCSPFKLGNTNFLSLQWQRMTSRITSF